MDIQQKKKFSSFSAYQNCLRALFVLSVALIYITPIASLIMTVCGLLALTTPKSLSCIKKIVFNPVFMATTLLLILMTIHLFSAKSVLPQDTSKAYIRWLIFIPCITMGILLQEKHWQSIVLYAFLVTTCVSALCGVIYQSVILHHPTFDTFLQHNHLLYKIFFKPTTEHIQELATCYAVACSLLWGKVIATEKNNISKRIVYFILFALMFFGIISQIERVGYLVLLITLPFITWMHIGWKRACTLALLLISLLSIFYYIQPGFIGKQFHQRIYNMEKNINFPWNKGNSDRTTSSTAIRIDGMKWGWTNIRKKPLWGYGMGAFNTRGNRSMVAGTFTPSPYPSADVEISYMVIALELGIIGLGVFMWLLYGYWRMAIDATTEKHQQAEFHTILLSTMVGGLTFPLFFTNLGLVIFFTGTSLIVGKYLSHYA